MFPCYKPERLGHLILSGFDPNICDSSWGKGADFQLQQPEGCGHLPASAYICCFFVSLAQQMVLQWNTLELRFKIYSG